MSMTAKQWNIAYAESPMINYFSFMQVRERLWDLKTKGVFIHFGTNDAEKRLPFWLCECKKVRVLENG